MSRGLLGGGMGLLAVALSLAGCGELYRLNEGPVGERHRPVLEAVWAQPEIGDSELWRIYVRATDPDGDLDKVFITFGQIGRTFPGQVLILPPSQRERTNGVLLVWARLVGGGMGTTVFGSARLHVEDRAGNVSGARSFQFTVAPDGRKDEGRPPQGFDREVVLGQVDFPLTKDIKGGT